MSYLIDSDYLIDVLIGRPAAIAIHHNLHLVTRNLRHFARVPGLSIYEDA